MLADYFPRNGKARTRTRCDLTFAPEGLEYRLSITFFDPLVVINHFDDCIVIDTNENNAAFWLSAQRIVN